MLRIVFLLIGIAVLTVLIWYLGLSEILDLLERIGWHALPIFFVYAAYQGTRALALRSCVARPGVVGYRDALAIRLAGTAIQSLTLLGPFIVEPASAWLLKRHGLTLKEGFAATITEQLIYSFVTAGMTIGGLLYLVRHFEPSPVIRTVAISIAWGLGAFLAVSAIAIASRFYLIGTIIAWLARSGLLRGRLRPDMSWINRMEDILLAVLRDRPGRFVSVTLIELMAQGLLVFELFLMLRALQLVTLPSYPFVIEASTKVAGVASLFIPLQLGATEGTYTVVFNTLGLPAAAGVALALARRVRSLMIAGVGLAALGRLSRES